MSTSDVGKEFRELDESFINFSEASKPLVFHTHDMLIQHGFELPIRVSHAGSTITYSFATVQGDISFSAVFHSADGRPSEVIIQPHRVPSDVENITGRFKAGREGTLAIKFDNAFSWFTPKYLSYSVEMHAPSHAAADTHRCAKSKSMLKTLLEEKPALETELVESLRSSHALRSELVDLEVTMRALALQVEAKNAELKQKLDLAVSAETRLEQFSERRAGLCLRTLNRELLMLVHAYLYADAEAAKGVAMVCKHWLALSRKQPLFQRLFAKFQVVFVLGGPGRRARAARVVSNRCAQGLARAPTAARSSRPSSTRISARGTC